VGSKRISFAADDAKKKHLPTIGTEAFFLISTWSSDSIELHGATHECVNHPHREVGHAFHLLADCRGRLYVRNLSKHGQDYLGPLAGEHLWIAGNSGALSQLPKG
jgi:hypothetical protein